MNEARRYTFFDRLCLSVDEVVRTLGNTAKATGRKFPANTPDLLPWNESQRKTSAALMRINHAGEVCAQALYQGQALVSHHRDTARKMQQAALEEGDHLHWCQLRLQELQSHASYLNPLWYSGSFCIGMVAGMIGDDWSLGFVAETERQVIAHLQGHLEKLAERDLRSHEILQQMAQDEAKHRDEAVRAGARELPKGIKNAMQLLAKVMVKVAYWV